MVIQFDLRPQTKSHYEFLWNVPPCTQSSDVTPSLVGQHFLAYSTADGVQAATHSSLLDTIITNSLNVTNTAGLISDIPAGTYTLQGQWAGNPATNATFVSFRINGNPNPIEQRFLNAGGLLAGASNSAHHGLCTFTSTVPWSMELRVTQTGSVTVNANAPKLLITRIA